MSGSKRGPERRSHAAHGASGNPAREPREDTPERREGRERRRNGYVSRLELCRGLPYDDVEAILEQCPRQALQAREVLLEPGQPNHQLYFLISGRLEIRLKSLESPAADVITPGECAGEMSIIDGQPTSAYVVATQPSEVIAVHENIFWSKIAVNPEVVRNLSRVLAERMRRRNDATLLALEQEMRLQQLTKELQAAHEIQIGMLPPVARLLPDHPRVDVYARMEVVKSVGGDFYDVLTIDDDCVCAVIGDVSGKGMPAALFMVRALTLLRSELLRSGDLGDCLARVNRGLCESNLAHMFVSLAVVCIDVRAARLRYVNAGHLPMLIARAGEPFEAVDESRGLIAGVLSDTDYVVGTWDVAPGDRFVLVTDGVTETRDRERRFYGMDRLRALLDATPATDAATLANTIYDDTRRFAVGSPTTDDITIVTVTLN